jgi:hypothetical protein
MKIVSRTVTPFLTLGAAIALVLAACNNVGSCPSTITPGGSCNGDNLECPYTIQTTSSMCSSLEVDGAVATSCICNDGVWQCPACTGDDGGEEAGGDATTEGGGEAGGDSSADVTVEATVDSGHDGSLQDAGQDAGHEASVEASTDGPVESSSTDSSTTDGAHD